MEEWKEYVLSELIDEISMGPFGSNIKVECFTDSGVPVLNGSNLVGLKLNEDKFNYVTEEKAASLGKANAYRNDIVITHRGTLGQIVYIPQNSKYDHYVISQSQFRIRCNQKVLPEYLVYYFHTRIGQHQLLSSASQVGVPALARPTTTFQKLRVVLPPLPTQQKIAAILSSLDDKIELNNKINTNLEQQAQALFKNWFVDFEPFGGKMPEGWKVGKLSDIAEITSGKRPPMKQSDYSKDVSIPLVGAASVMGYTNQVLYNEPILITGRVGTHGVIQRFSTECWPSDNTLVVKSQYYEYVYQIMCNIDYDNMNRGSTQPLITQSDLGKVECIIPDEGNLNKFEQLTNNLFAKVQENQLENQKLANIRDTLLPKLMNGEISIE